MTEQLSHQYQMPAIFDVDIQYLHVVFGRKIDLVASCSDVII